MRMEMSATTLQVLIADRANCAFPRKFGGTLTVTASIRTGIVDEESRNFCLIPMLIRDSQKDGQKPKHDISPNN